MRRKILLTVALALCWGLAGQAASPLKVAYVTNVATPPATDGVFATLNRNFDATAINNANPDAAAVATWVNTYDVIVVSEFANSGNTQLKNLTKPVVMMKGHALTQDARWGWSAKNSGLDATGIEQNLLSQKSLKVAAADQGKGLFKGLDFVGDSVKLLDVVGMDNTKTPPQYKGFIAIEPRSGVAITNAASIQPTPASNCDKVVFIMPQGALADGTNAMLSNYVYLGISQNSFQYLTANARQLIVNAVKTLGGETPTGKEEMPVKMLYVTDAATSLPTDPLYNSILAAGHDVKLQYATAALTVPDTAGVDMVLLSEYIGGNNILNYRNLSKSVFTMKGHTLNAAANRWAWQPNSSAVQGTTQTKMYVSSSVRTGNSLFANVTFVDDSTQLLSQVGIEYNASTNAPTSKGLIGIKNMYPRTFTNVGTSNLGGSDTVMFYLPAGSMVSAAGGTSEGAKTALLSDYFYFGISAINANVNTQSGANFRFMTKNTIQIALNAIAKLTGTAAKVVADAAFTLETATGGTVTGKKTDAYYAGEYYSMTATADANYTFVKWEKKEGATYSEFATTAAISGCMPASLTLRPVFQANAPEPSNKIKLKVAYASKKVLNDSILAVLKRNFTDVTNEVRTDGTLTAADSAALAAYDVVVLSGGYDGGNLAKMQNFPKPVLVMHGGAMVEDNNYYTTKAGMNRWNRVVSRGGHIESVAWDLQLVFQRAIEVEPTDKSSNLYKGLKFIGNTACLLDTIGRSGSTYVGLITTGAPKVGGQQAKVVPGFTTISNNSAVYFQPKGSKADGSTMLVSNYCYLGLSLGATNFINANMKQLIVNAVKVVADSVPTGMEEMGGVATPSVTSINMPTTLSLRVPAIETLKPVVVATKLADKVARFSSNNLAVATVDQWGVVQAVSAGTATITATCADGTVSASCAVTVSGAAEVLLSEDFTDWQKRTAKLNLVNIDSQPNYPSNKILNEVTVTRPLKGSAAGANVDFDLKNCLVVPFAGSRYLNEYPGVLTVSGTQNNNASQDVKTDPAVPTDPTQGEPGTLIGAESCVTIGVVDKEVKTIELVLSMFGDSRVAFISKSYDNGRTWVNADAVLGGSDGRLGYFIIPNMIANRYIINLPKAEKNFMLRIGPGRQTLTSVRTDNINVHSVKYYAPNSVSTSVASVSMQAVSVPSSARISRDTIYMTVPQTWCESAGVVQMGYTCLPADASNTAVSWTSSNTGAVLVDATGNLVPRGSGTSTITVTTTDGSNKTATMVAVVTTKSGGSSVVCPETVKIQKTWSSLYLQLRPDSTYQLTSVVTPVDATHKKVAYSTLSPDFASVDTLGVVKGVNKGWATIVATVVTPNEAGDRVTDTIDIQILAPIYIGGDPAPDSGAPKLPVVIDARAWTPTQRLGDGKLDEPWAESKWFDFAKTGLRKKKDNDSSQYMNQTRIQGVYLNLVDEGGNVADFANIGLKTTKVAGRQTRLIFAFDGELDSLKFGIVVGGATYPSTVAVQQSNNAETWDDVHYVVNETSATKENEVPAVWTQLTPNVYKYITLKTFSKNARFVRFFQTESGSSSAVAHNIYFDGFWFYGGNDNPNAVRKQYTADYGINVYPNPTGGDLYLSGEKAITRVDVVNLSSGQITKRLPMGGVAATSLSMADLAAGTYLVVIFVEGSNLPQVVKVNRQ